MRAEIRIVEDGTFFGTQVPSADTVIEFKGPEPRGVLTGGKPDGLKQTQSHDLSFRDGEVLFLVTGFADEINDSLAPQGGPDNLNRQTVPRKPTRLKVSNVRTEDSAQNSLMTQRVTQRVTQRHVSNTDCRRHVSSYFCPWG